MVPPSMTYETLIGVLGAAARAEDPHHSPHLEAALEHIRKVRTVEMMRAAQVLTDAGFTCSIPFSLALLELAALGVSFPRADDHAPAMPRDVFEFLAADAFQRSADIPYEQRLAALDDA